MTPEEASATEATILDVCRATVATMERKLAERGLKCEPPRLVVFNSDPDHYGSEVQAMILREGQIVDVLEFFVYWNGRESLTPEEAERFTREVLFDAYNHR
jgi:hypothetical protein